MENKKLYIAYGSNTNLKQMAVRCPNSKVIGKAMLKGHELEFRIIATIVPKKDAEVPVLIWEIDQRDERNLDRYEGYPQHYRKENFDVELNGETLSCVGYVMTHGDIAPPSELYYNAILTGYLQHDMDVSCLQSALSRSIMENQSQQMADQADECQMELE